MERRSFLKKIGAAGVGSSLLITNPLAKAAMAQETTTFLPTVMGGVTDATEAGTQNKVVRAAAAGGSTSILVAAENAPSVIKDAAHYICNGSNDHETINNAINSLNGTGGLVQLSEGTFKCSGAVRVPRRITLFGKGRSTILQAHGSWQAHDGSWPGAVIEPYDNGTDKTWIGSLAIDGNRTGGADVQGVYYNITNKQNFDEGPDAAHWFTDLYIHDTKRHAFRLKGNQNRGNKTARIRVWNPGQEPVNGKDLTTAHGFFLECPDSYYIQCESGSSTGSGFYVAGNNCHFVSCKAWFADQSGWQIRSVRGEYSSCESQDNEEHGFYITSGPNSLMGCHADSNSWRPSSPTSSYDGFHLPWTQRVQLIGCSAYDKSESNRGHWQRHGFFLGESCKHCQIIGTVKDNVSSGLAGPGSTSSDNVVIVNG